MKMRPIGSSRYRLVLSSPICIHVLLYEAGGIPKDSIVDKIISPLRELLFGRLRALRCSHEHLLFFQQLRERPVLVHGHQDVTATDKLLLNVELRYRGPFRVLFDACNFPLTSFQVTLMVDHDSPPRAIPKFHHPFMTYLAVGPGLLAH